VESFGTRRAFNDPMIDNKESKKRRRADVLIEGAIEKMEDKIEKEVEKAAKKFGESFDRGSLLQPTRELLNIKRRSKRPNARLKDAMSKSDMAELKQIIVDLEITDEDFGHKKLDGCSQFNLMFLPEMGSVASDTDKIYLRPETAQGIFVNFLNVQKRSPEDTIWYCADRKSIPYEIVSAASLSSGCVNSEQMEMQFFVKPGEEIKWLRALEGKENEVA